MPQVRVPIEYVVVIIIAVLIAVIVSYAFGVERGKHVALDMNGAGSSMNAGLEVEEKPLLDVAMVEKQAEELMKRADAKEPMEPGASEDAALSTRDPQGKIVSSLKNAGKDQASGASMVQTGVTICSLQLASTKNEVYAEAEIAKLKNKGFAASIAKKGDWFKVYIPFTSIEEAEKVKKKLSGDYKDCLIVRTKTQVPAGQ